MYSGDDPGAIIIYNCVFEQVPIRMFSYVCHEGGGGVRIKLEKGCAGVDSV